MAASKPFEYEPIEGHQLLCVCSECFSKNQAKIHETHAFFFRGLLNETDRGLVLVVAAVFDELLEQLLRAKFARDSTIEKDVVDPMFKPRGLLLGSRDRADLARALKLVDQTTFQNLRYVRDLRNKFAHAFAPCSFEDSKVWDIVRNLADYDGRATKNLTHGPNDAEGTKQRSRFVSITQFMGGILSGCVTVFHRAPNSMVRD